VIDVTALLRGCEPPAAIPRRAGVAADESFERKPVVVWSVTRTCNLACVHCAADSAAEAYPGELSTAEGRALLDDLAQFGVRDVVLAGGEPLVRRDTLELIEYGRALGLTFTLFTNGTLLDLGTARRIRESRVRSVDVALDGIGATNDMLRGKRRAFERAVQGIRNCKAVGQTVALRLTLTPQVAADLEAIFDFVEREDIARVTFAHVVSAGRGTQCGLTHGETRRALRAIACRARQSNAGGDSRTIFTVDNYAGGCFSSGVGTGAVDPQGFVHPDRFWQTATLGNVKERTLSDIWTDPTIELLAGLRDRLPRMRGRCASCRYLELCGGNFRVRAFAETGDAWAPDPACYLSDAQIANDAEIVLV
jgi:radical SAM protein with 4Fe4S-binding SPASM domain